MSKRKSESSLEVWFSWVLGLYAVAFIMSIPILVTGIWQRNHHCVKFMEEANFIFAILLFVFSLIGLIALCCRDGIGSGKMIVVNFVLFFALFIFTTYAFSVTRMGGKGEVIPGRSYKEYRIGDYSKYVRKWINDNTTWSKEKSCLQNDQVCKSLEDSNLTKDQLFYRKKLSPIQSGCCKPPTSCGFTYVNATVWNKPGGISMDLDCNLWSNDQSSLCYDCQACKAGVLATFQKDWNNVAYVYITFLLLFFFAILSACCLICHAPAP